ncbi:eukaryotic translation initiation factor 4 gamma 1 isoform X6 [Cloeon dipterum]|uniref:eukaryotic translation initiation factor 4 gamma 1 isoform X6 n=1 Tax=Cloeon dipterum TaxID=197152 RepID=UPI00321FA667
MSLPKGKHQTGTGQQPQQRQQYPAPPAAYGGPPPTNFPYILQGRSPHEASRVGAEQSYGGQGGHLYGAAAQNAGQQGMRAAQMQQPPNPSSTPPGQQQPQQMTQADLGKPTHAMQQQQSLQATCYRTVQVSRRDMYNPDSWISGNTHGYQYLQQQQPRGGPQQFLTRNQINPRMQQNQRPAPNTMSQTPLGYSQLPQQYMINSGMAANHQIFHVPYAPQQPNRNFFPPNVLPYYVFSNQQAQAVFHAQPGMQPTNVIYNTMSPSMMVRGSLNQPQSAQHVMPAPAPAPTPPHHQQQVVAPQMQSAGMPPPPPQQQPIQPNPPSARRKNAIKIIDPDSGKDVLEEMQHEKNSNAPTPPRSGDSSARQTPQPSQVDNNVAAEFAAKVAIAANDSGRPEEPAPAPVIVEAPRPTSAGPTNGPVEEPKPKAMVWVAPEPAKETPHVETVALEAPKEELPAPSKPQRLPKQQQPSPPAPVQPQEVPAALPEEQHAPEQLDGRNQWRQSSRKPPQKEAASKEATPAPAPVPEPEPVPVPEPTPVEVSEPKVATPPEQPEVVAEPKAPSPPPPQQAAKEASPPHVSPPSNAKTASPAPAAAPVEPSPPPKEEPKMVTVEDKLVAAKNEENARVVSDSVAAPASDNGSNTPTVIEQQLPELTSKLVYSDDQWSPSNTSGKKKYARDFLMQLQYNSQSLKRPEDLPKLEVVIDKSRPVNTRPVGNLNRTDAGNLLMPTFMNPASRGSLLRKSSQQGKPKPTKVILNLSLNEDVKLNETENAWKPNVLSQTSKSDDVNLENEDLFKRFRAVLNKLTPQKFEILVEQVKKMDIDTKEKLKGVIDLVFDKSVDEPGFCEMYAKLCYVLSRLNVVVSKTNDGKGKTEEAFNFKKELLHRCQEEFQKEKQSKSRLNEQSQILLKEIDEATGDKKRELIAQLEEDERRMRKKYVGVNRFIGELYKMQMLNGNIMMQCICKLLESSNEESLECLCKLLTTIGQDLETRQEKDKKVCDLEPQIKIMRQIAGNRKNGVSSRIRFMIQDVIELREANWKSRRGDQAPKTMDAIAKEAEQEHMAINLNQQTPMRGSKDDRDRPGKRGRGGMSDDGWMTSGGGNRLPSSMPRSAPIDSNKLKQIKPQEEHSLGSLGSRDQFTNWSKGSSSSNSKGKVDPVVPQTNNKYNLLSQDMDKQPLMTMSGSQGQNSRPRRSRDNLIGKNSSSGNSVGLATNAAATDLLLRPEGSSVNRHSRSNSREGSQQRQVEALVAPQAKAKPVAKEEVPILGADELEKKASLLLDEYLNSDNRSELVRTMRSEMNSSQYQEALYCWINRSLDWTGTKRAKLSEAMKLLFSEELFTTTVLSDNFKEFLNVASDAIIDIPKIFTYLAEIYAPLIASGVVTFATLEESFMSSDKDSSVRMLLACFRHLELCKGPAWIRTNWQKCNMQLRKFSSEVDKFLADNHLTYLSESSRDFQVATTPRMSAQEMHDRVVTLIQADSLVFEDVSLYIDVNVGNEIKTPKYIRALTTTVCEVSTSNEQHRLSEDMFNRYSRLICKYVDQVPDLEMHALYAIQAFVTRLQHPPTLLRTILTLLLEEMILSKDAIRAWINSDDAAEQEGRGVALKSIHQFITWLEEPEESGEEGS